MHKVKTKLFVTLFLHLSIFTFSQDLIYQFKDDFNNNKNHWRLVNTPDWESKIENGYFSIANKTQNQISYFRPDKNVIPKSARYEITAKISFEFGKIGENYMSGGFNFIQNEIISDGSYSTKNDDIKIGFTKFQNKSFVIFEGLDAVFSWKPIDFDLTENEEYNIKILIDNTTDSNSIKIKINETLVCTYNANLFNFTNLGIFNYPNGNLQVNELEINSYSGNLKYIDDLFCSDYTVDKNGQIISQQFKSIADYENILLDFIPKELINLHKTPIDKRNVEKLLEKLAINPEIKNYKILPEKKNEFNIVEQHCFHYRNGDNAICLPISIGKNNIKIIMTSYYMSNNKRKLISYSNVLSTLFNLTNIKSIGNDIIMERNGNSFVKLFIDENRVIFWF